MNTEVIEQVAAQQRQRGMEAKTKAVPVCKQTWRDAIGSMKDCDLLDEAVRLGAEWRAKANTIED